MAPRSKKTAAPVLDLSGRIDALVASDGRDNSFAVSRLPPPHVDLRVGTPVVKGSLEECRVVRVLNEGRRVVVLGYGWKRPQSGSEPEREEVLGIDPWFDVQPVASVGETAFAVKLGRLDLNYSQRVLEGLIHYVSRSGVEDSPPYQRGLVWSQEDKDALIDSIFKRLDIGKFVFIKRAFHVDDAHYTVLDGKQRLNAVMEFVTDRFPYQGVYWSQLSRSDRRAFEGIPVSFACINTPLSHREELELFLRLNATGRAQSPEHLASLRRELSELTATPLPEKARRPAP